MSEFYSDDYIKLLRKFHKKRLKQISNLEPGDYIDESIEYKGWGCMAFQFRYTIRQLCDAVPTDSILDYGCGTGITMEEFMPKEYDVLGYDPAVEGKEDNNVPRDFVVCCDVLEHIEEEFIDNVLADIRRCTIKSAFITIDTKPASAKLPDGRNAHVTLKPKEWWTEKMFQYFAKVEYNDHTDRSILYHVHP